MNHVNILRLSQPNNDVKSASESLLLDTLETSDIESDVCIAESKHDFMTFYCLDCGNSYPVYMRCGDRCCPECRSRDYYRIISSYKPFLASKSALRLITLTLKGRTGFLPENRVRRIRRSFKILIKKSYYRNRIVGGIYSIEPKKKLVGWNIHIHILAEGSSVDVFKLSKDWHEITGDSYIVDIRRAWSGLGGLKYIIKYLTKAPETLGCNAEYNQAMRGIRLVSPFGTWYKKIVLLEKEPKICEICGGHNWVSINDLFWMSMGFGGGTSPPYDKDSFLKGIINFEMSADINRTSKLM